MRWLALVVALGCSSKKETPPAASPPPAKPTPDAAVAKLDRPPQALGGALTWASAEDVVALRFCPGDKELVSLEAAGRLRRYRVEDGAHLAVTEVANSETRGGDVDCRADGMALAFDVGRSPVLVDAAGKMTTPPSPIPGEATRFADNGAVLVLDEEGVKKWEDGKIDLAIKPHEHALYSALGEHGTYVELVYESGKASEDGTWLVRLDGTRIKLPQRPEDMDRVAVAQDGSVAIAGMMVAYLWVVKGKAAGRRQLMLDQSGTHIKAIAATNKWFAVIGADGDIWKAMRPGMKWVPIEKPCGEGEYPTAMAITNDDTRVAVACTNLGMRMFELASGKRIGKDGTRSIADMLAWSPSSDSLATRDQTSIKIWKAGALVTTIQANEGRALWWQSAAELGGIENGALATWTLDGKKTDTKIDAEVAARSAHGEIVVAHRQYDKGPAFAVVRDGKETPIELPESKWDWLDGVAVDDAGTRATLWRGQYNGQPALEVDEIDLASGKATAQAMKVTAVTLDATANTDGILAWKGKQIAVFVTEATAIAVTKNMIAVGDVDGAIRLWSTTGIERGKLAGHSGKIRALAFAPDGVHLASSASDGTKIWDLSP